MKNIRPTHFLFLVFFLPRLQNLTAQCVQFLPGNTLVAEKILAQPEGSFAVQPIVATSGWGANGQPAWASTSPAAGGAGNFDITVTATAANVTAGSNNDPARSGTIPFSCGAVLTVVQQGDGEFGTVSQHEFDDVPAAGQVFNVSLNAGGDWNAVSSDPSWLSVTLPANLQYALNQQVEVVVAAQGSGGGLRSGTVTFRCAGNNLPLKNAANLEAVVTVTQLPESPACSQLNAFSAVAASPLLNSIDVDLTPATAHLYDLPYLFGVNRNHVKNPGYHADTANYQAFVRALLKKYGTTIGRKKLYRHGGTMTDGNDGLVQCFGMTGWRHTVYDSQDGPYPYDKLSNFTAEAAPDRLDADLLVTVNFGSGTPADAAALVAKLDAAGQLDRVKFFSLGNEITLINQFGNGDRSDRYGTTATCPYPPYVQTTYPSASANYDLSNKCLLPQEYAENAALFIREMVAEAGAGNKLKIGLVVGHDTEMKGSPAGGNPGWSGGVDQNIQTIISTLKNLIGENAPPGENLEDSVDLFFDFHGYGGWPILNGLADPCAFGPTPCDVPGYDDLSLAKGLFAAEYDGEERIRNLLYTNLSCKTDKLFGNPAYQWNGQAIKLGITEYSTYLHGGRQGLWHTATEALFSADNLLTALKMDLEMSVAYAIHHDAPAADDLFFGGYDPAVNYHEDSLHLIAEKPAFKLHAFLDDHLRDTVVATYDGNSSLYRVQDFPLRLNSGAPVANYFFPALSFAMTKDPALDHYAFVVLNRSDSVQKVTNLAFTGMTPGVWSATIHSLAANGYADTAFLAPTATLLTSGKAVAGGKLTLANVDVPKLSVSVIEIQPVQDCISNRRVENLSPIPAATYRSQGLLTSHSATVAASSPVVFKSDTGVLLTNDFLVEMGGAFEVVIEPCPGN